MMLADAVLGVAVGRFSVVDAMVAVFLLPAFTRQKLRLSSTQNTFVPRNNHASAQSRMSILSHTFVLCSNHDSATI